MPLKQSKERTLSKECVYLLRNPERCSGRVVDAMARVLDGPQPMKDGKSGERNPNAADQFWTDHQAEYERRGKSAEPIDVEEYNAYPKMQLLLEKKHCTAKVAVSATVAANPVFDPNCRLCQKMKAKMESESKSFKRTHRIKLRADNKTKRCEHRARVAKPKRVQKCKTTLKARKTFKCNCRYCSKYTNKGTCTNLVSKEAETTCVPVEVDVENVFFSNAAREPSLKSTNQSKSRNSDVFTGSAVSVHSYNSNMSLDHEPMGSS